MLLQPASDFTEKAGRLLAYLALTIAHELGHALLETMRGWRTELLTFGITSGLYEFRLDEIETDAVTKFNSDIIVSWAGVTAELLILPGTILLFLMGLWPDGSLFQGVFIAFTLYTAIPVVLNLLLIKGDDGEIAWR